MLDADNYRYAWVVYILASSVGLYCLWRLQSKFPAILKHLICIIVAAILYTPAISDPSQEWLAPAVVTAVLDAVSNGPDYAMRAAQNILQVLAIAIGLYFVLLIAWYRLKKNKQTPEPTGSDAEVADSWSTSKEIEEVEDEV